jgi:hypothetical protein
MGEKYVNSASTSITYLTSQTLRRNKSNFEGLQNLAQGGAARARCRIGDLMYGTGDPLLFGGLN